MKTKLARAIHTAGSLATMIVAGSASVKLG